jgi:hypothetical protein
MQWPGLRELVIELAIMLAIVFGVALMGPFGTFQMGGLAARLGYWALMILGGYAIVRPLIALAPVIAERLAFPEGVVWAALVLVAGVPVTLLVWFGGGGTEAPNAEAFLHLYPNVVLLGGIVSLLFWLRRAMRVAGQLSDPVAVPAAASPAAEAAASAEVGGEPPLLARLPVHRRGALRALEMEDHYVRVHTSAGTHMLLMRMRDAVAEVGPAAGEQVHRSWWVARDAVEGQAGQGRTIRLKLAGGIEAPVARASVARLRELGWIA